MATVTKMRRRATCFFVFLSVSVSETKKFTDKIPRESLFRLTLVKQSRTPKDRERKARYQPRLNLRRDSFLLCALKGFFVLWLSR